MTLKEAKELGYRETFWSWERGYFSRTSPADPECIKVYAAGGIRKGLLYYYKPSWRSTQYCIRQYLRKPDNGGCDA